MPGAEEAMPRYFGIIRGKELPLFKLLRKIECRKHASLEYMWKEHEGSMKLFRNEKKKGSARLSEKPDAPYSLLDLKYDIALELLKSCVFCERKCRVNRADGEKGWCRVGAVSRVATMFSHFGEESFLVPSGTIFFTGCTWSCVYCQNWDISQFPERGAPMSGREIAEWIDRRAASGQIINANFVGGEPTPNLHTILDTMRHLKGNAAMVWNSNMYMSEESIKLLDGAIDVYLADFRYGNDKCAMQLSSVPKYWKTMTRNFRLCSATTEMLIRILVLPNHVEDDAGPILRWIGKNIANRSYVNLMRQYAPQYKAVSFPDINRSLIQREYESAVRYLKKYKIKYYEIQ